MYMVGCALFRGAHGRYFETTYAIFRGRDFRNNAHARYFENLRYIVRTKVYVSHLLFGYCSNKINKLI